MAKVKNEEVKQEESCTHAPEGVKGCAGDGCAANVRQEPEKQEERLLEPGNIAFFRKQTNEIAVALIVSVDPAKKTASFFHFGKSTFGKAASAENIKIGTRVNQVWHDYKELAQAVKIDGRIAS